MSDDDECAAIDDVANAVNQSTISNRKTSTVSDIKLPKADKHHGSVSTGVKTTTAVAALSGDSSNQVCHLADVTEVSHSKWFCRLARIFVINLHNKYILYVNWIFFCGLDTKQPDYVGRSQVETFKSRSAWRWRRTHEHYFTRRFDRWYSCWTAHGNPVLMVTSV